MSVNSFSRCRALGAIGREKMDLRRQGGAQGHDLKIHMPGLPAPPLPILVVDIFPGSSSMMPGPTSQGPGPTASMKPGMAFCRVTAQERRTERIGESDYF